MAEFNGKYRAYVHNVNDPQKRGRIQVTCPKIGASYVSAWCEPCFSGDDFYLPPVGSCVWIEFQQGDLKKPIWTGSWLAENTAPTGGGTRIISYGGAIITLMSGKVFINGVDVLDNINSLEKRIESLERLL